VSRGLLDFPQPSRKFSAEERDWMARMRHRQLEAWKPPAGTVLGAAAVNGMTADAQWQYKADSSTRGAKVAARKRAPARVSVADKLRARVRELEAEVAELTGLLDAATMPVAA
jgi:hypothetical protein